MLPRRLLVPVLAAALLGLAGCASGDGTMFSSSGSIMDRVDRHRDEYETWPIEVKQAVLDGKVAKGMTPTMVEVALGKPSEVVSRGGGDEVWVYKIRGSSSGSSGGGIGGTTVTVGTGYPSGVYYPGTGGVYGGTGGVYGSNSGIYTSGIPVAIPLPSSGGGYENDIEREVIFRDGIVARADPAPKVQK